MMVEAGAGTCPVQWHAEVFQTMLTLAEINLRLMHKEEGERKAG